MHKLGDIVRINYPKSNLHGQIGEIVQVNEGTYVNEGPTIGLIVRDTFVASVNGAMHCGFANEFIRGKHG